MTVQWDHERVPADDNPTERWLAIGLDLALAYAVPPAQSSLAVLMIRSRDSPRPRAVPDRASNARRCR